MRIAFVTTGDIARIATSKRAFGMAGPLSKLGYQVGLIAQDTVNNRERREIECPSADGLWFEGGSLLHEIKAKQRLIANFAPDIVYVCSFGARNLIVPFRSYKKAIYLVEHSELLSAIKGVSIAHYAKAKIFEFASPYWFDGQVCASQYLKNYFAQAAKNLSDRAAVLYLPYAYSDEQLTPVPADVEELLLQYEGKVKIVYMGTLAANYGILDILEAMHVLKNKGPDFRCIVLGDGRHAQMARERAEALGVADIVDFKGYVPDRKLPAYLSIADIFVAPIFNTTQDIARCPSKLYMYSAYNVPIVTSPFGEAKELLGENPFYFQPGNSLSMADALQRAAERTLDWSPSWVAAEQSWMERSKVFVAWVKDCFGDRFHWGAS